MARPRFLVLFALCILALLPLTATAQRLGVSVRAGTDGIGGALTARLIPTLNARVQGGFFAYGMEGVEPIDYEDDSVDMQWNADAQLFTLSALADWHPFKNAFRLSGGAYFNGIEGNGGIRPTESIFVQSGSQQVEFTPEELGSMDMTVDYPSVAPYLGLGFGNAAKHRFGFSLDIGAMYMGEPRVTLSGEGGIAPTASPENEAAIQQSIEDAQFYPVISLGISTRLF